MKNPFASINKAVAGALSVAVAVEATGFVTGTADHYLQVGIAAATAAIGGGLITYFAPANKTNSVSNTDAGAVAALLAAYDAAHPTSQAIPSATN